MTAESTRFDTGVESCLALLPGLPEFWSYSSLKEIGICPRQWALTRASYPELWEGRGYPQFPTLPALFGDIVHDVLDTLVKAFAAAGCESPKNAAAVGVLRQLGGYTAVIESAVEDRLAPLKTNPRLSDDRQRRLERDLRSRVPEARVQVQTYLSKSSFAPSKPTSAPAGQPSADATGRSAAFGRKPLAPGTHAEITLASEELRLMGRMDLLHISGTGADITDYKTGAEDPGHRDQLELYALLWDLDRVVNPDRLPVASLTAAYSSRDITFPAPDESRKRELERTLATWITAAETELSTASPRAVPTADNCRNCDVRHLCSDYWSVIPPDPATLADHAKFDCEGTVGAQNGPHSWWLHREGIGQRELLLQTPSAGPELTTGSRVRILGLRSVKEPESDTAIASMVSSTEVFRLTAGGPSAR